MEMIPEASEMNVAIALCESKGDFDAAVEYLLDSKKKRKYAEDSQEDEGRDYALGTFASPLFLL